MIPFTSIFADMYKTTTVTKRFICRLLKYMPNLSRYHCQ